MPDTETYLPLNLLDASLPPSLYTEMLCPGVTILRHAATAQAAVLLDDLAAVVGQSPFRQMLTPGGFEMSVGMTNCGTRGWVSDQRGYRYSVRDSLSGKPWPEMPVSFLVLATQAAAQAGFLDFLPDACLVNRYRTGAKMSLHQDKDERDLKQPIVSVSLGLPAVFLFGGKNRSDKTVRTVLKHGDIVVWGGPVRLNYHGVLPLKPGFHPLVGDQRINLTFRKVH